MSLSYNQLAGNSVERLAALSDGIFAVAMTLLVLDLHVPSKAAIHSSADLSCALKDMGPQLITYLMSFLTLGIFWNGQQVQLNHIQRADRHLTWIHIAFLFTVSIVPFSTRLLSEFITYPLALVCYWGNLLLLGLTLFLSWRCAVGQQLVKTTAPPDLNRAITRRIVTAQALYAFGALLCVFNSYASIALFVLVQLNYAIAPRFPRRKHRSQRFQPVP